MTRDTDRNRLVEAPADPQVLDTDGRPVQVNITINMADPSEFRHSNSQIAARVQEAIRANRNRHEVFGRGPGQRFAEPPKHVNCRSTLPVPTAPNVLGPPKREIRL